MSPTQGPVPLPPETPVDLPGTAGHGTFAAYQRHGCRCLVCQTFMRAYSMRRRLAPGPAPEGTHGTVSTYNYYGCRCGACCEARRSYDRHAYELRQQKRKGQKS